MQKGILSLVLHSCTKKTDSIGFMLCFHSPQTMHWYCLQRGWTVHPPPRTAGGISTQPASENYLVREEGIGVRRAKRLSLLYL